MPWFKQDRYAQIFEEIDNDKDGLISHDDLFSFLRKNEYMGPPDLIATSFRNADLDHTGKISYNEFIIAMGYDPTSGQFDFRSLRNAKLRQIFMKHDDDKNGTVDRKHLKDIFAELGTHVSNVELRNCMDLCDQEGKGPFDYEAFIQKLVLYNA